METPAEVLQNLGDDSITEKQSKQEWLEYIRT